jgi:sterol 24-C-methyltransferase
MKQAGFQIISSKDASMGGHQLPLINGERQQYAWIRFFARIFLPSRFMVLLRRLRKDAEAFVKADELSIATTSYQIVCQKPIQMQ